MDEHTQPGHPVGPEIDDSQNPTMSAPDEWSTADQEPGTQQPRDEAVRQAQDETPPRPDQDETAPRQTGAGREMLSQLQSMIDTLAVQAGPVMREVAAKAAELAAVAGEKAGPLAQKAAEKTGEVGQRVAARSKVMAADLRRPTETTGDAPFRADATATEKEPDDSVAE